MTTGASSPENSIGVVLAVVLTILLILSLPPGAAHSALAPQRTTSLPRAETLPHVSSEAPGSVPGAHSGAAPVLTAGHPNPPTPTSGSLPAASPINTTVSSINVGSGPDSAIYDPADGDIYVRNEGSDNVSVINGTSVVRSIPVGASYYNDSGMAFDSRNSFVYVANYGSDSVTIINGTTSVGSVNVGDGPRLIAYDSGNGYVYVPNSGSNNVTVISGTKRVATVSLSELSIPSYATYDPTDGRVYVGTGGGTTGLTVLNGTKVVGVVDTGGADYYASPATYDSQDGFVYVPNLYPGNISVINGTELIGALDLLYPYPLTYDGGNGYVYDSGGGFVATIHGTTVLPTWVFLGLGADGFSTPAVDIVNGYLYVPNQSSDNVSVIDGTRLVGSENVGSAPASATFDSGNGNVYVTNFASDNVSVLRVGYRMTVTETGLPTGAGWWFNVTDGPSAFSSNSTLSFNESSGTHPYTVSTTAKNYSAIAGSFEAPGGPFSFPITFSLAPYPVVFTESGLAVGTNWSVTVGGVSRTSSAATIEFQEPNGTHAYNFGPVPGWRTEARPGSVTVRGEASDVAVAWLRVTYSVVLGEDGLPPWTEWWINLSSGPSTVSSGPTLSLTEPNGTYSYAAASVDKAYESPGGSVSVNGSNVSQSVEFTEVNYTVTFTEIGLPSGVGWWVNVSGISQGYATAFSTTTAPSFNESNGTYSYSAQATDRTYGAAGGSFTVDGAPLGQVVAFSRATYPVTFTEAGLPSGTVWSVTSGGTVGSQSGAIATLALPNGTYPFSIGEVPGFRATPSNGSLSVRGSPIAFDILFTPTTGPAPPLLNLDAILSAFLVAAVAAAAVVVLWVGWRKSPPRP